MGDDGQGGGKADTREPWIFARVTSSLKLKDEHISKLNTSEYK